MKKNENECENLSNYNSVSVKENDELDQQAFKVYVRIRPFNEREKSANLSLCKSNINSKIIPNSRYVSYNNTEKSILVTEDNLVFVLGSESGERNGRKERCFVFDEVFKEDLGNYQIFDLVFRKMIDNVVQGFNSTAMAYGVTGTGKTHTIFGTIGRENMQLDGDSNFKNDARIPEKGIYLYALEYLFDLITKNENNKTFEIKISYLEIYNEHVKDLLVEKSRSLMIVEDSIKGVIVPDLSELVVTNSKDLVRLIIAGNSRRIMAQTNLNQFSSRSHAILQVVVEQRNKTRDIKEEFIISKFLIVDLAGSERGGLKKGIRTQEGSNINKSLLSLGNCINLLSDKTRKGAFVPYRDSKLTRMLKDSLGGNIQTAMIACVSPSHLTYDETVNTLKYATRARAIEKKIKKNIKEVGAHISQYKEIIDSLKNEIDQLKKIILNQEDKINKKAFLSSEDKVKIDNASHLSLNQEKRDEVKKKSIKQHISLSSEQDKDYNIIDASDLWINQPLTKSNVLNKNDSYLAKHSRHITKPNCLQFDEEKYNNFLTSVENYSSNYCEANENFENLEKQIDNLQQERALIEDAISKCENIDKPLSEKYNQIKICFGKFLQLVNDKLIENMENNMILKFNMKEILDLNQENKKRLNEMCVKIKFNEGLFDENIDRDLSKLKDEVTNIEMTIQENENVKEKISESLIQNVNAKQIFKNILMKLISYNTNLTNLQDPSRTDLKIENFEKEKKELEKKNKTYQEILSSVLQEKKQKDHQLNQIQKELMNLKKQLADKDDTIKQIERNGSKHRSLMTRDKNFKNSKQQEDTDLYIKPLVTESEQIEVNLQDDYFDNKRKSSLILIENQSLSLNQKDKKEKLNAQNIHNIRYIINQTNNIVNNNIKKIKKFEGERRIDTSKIKIEESVRFKQPNIRKTSCTPQPMHAKQKRLSGIALQTNFRIIEMNNDSKRSPIKSQKISRKKEFEKLIETQLNEIYSKRAKEFGDKIKQKITKNTPRPSRKFSYATSSKELENFNSILNKFQKVSETPNYLLNNRVDIPKENYNKNLMNCFDRSLSISCVSVKNEYDTISELELVVDSQERKTSDINIKEYEGLKQSNDRSDKETNYIINTSPKTKTSVELLRNPSIISKNLPHSSSVVPISRCTLSRNTVKVNKVANVMKFLSNDNSESQRVRCNVPEAVGERGKSFNKVEHSSSAVNLLKKARLEKQLRNNNYVESFLNKNEDKTPNIGLKHCNLNKFVNRNTANFLNEYALNLNKVSLSLENETKNDLLS